MNKPSITFGRGTYFTEVDESEVRNPLRLRWWPFEKLEIDDTVKVGRYCSIGSGVTFMLPSTEHSHTPLAVSSHPKFQNPALQRHKRGIVIGNDVWIGENSMLLPGTRVGDGAVISAGSVVSGKVKPYAVVGGNPAVLLFFRFDTETIAGLRRTQWWNWTEKQIEARRGDFNDVKSFVKKYA